MEKNADDELVIEKLEGNNNYCVKNISFILVR